MKNIKGFKLFNEDMNLGSNFDLKILNKAHHWKFLNTKEYLRYLIIKMNLSSREYDQLDIIFNGKKYDRELPSLFSDELPRKASNRHNTYSFRKSVNSFGKGSIKISGFITKIDPEPSMSLWNYSMVISLDYKIGEDTGRIIEDYIIFRGIEDINEFINNIEDWIEIDYSEE